MVLLLRLRAKAQVSRRIDKFRNVCALTFDDFQRRPIEFSPTSLLPVAAERVSVAFVKKGILALLALVLALHASFGCAMAQAETVLTAPCCGPNCPVPSSAGDRACCQVQNSGAPARAVSAKPSIPCFQPLTVLIPWYVLTPAPTVLERASVFEASPPGPAKLALLCSRQI